MAFHFGQDDSGFDWSSFLSNAITTAGQVTTAAITGGKTPVATTYPAGTTGLVPGYTPISSTTGGVSTTLLLGVAAVLGIVLFMRMKKR